MAVFLQLSAGYTFYLVIENNFLVAIFQANFAGITPLIDIVQNKYNTNIKRFLLFCCFRHK